MKYLLSFLAAVSIVAAAAAFVPTPPADAPLQLADIRPPFERAG